MSHKIQRKQPNNNNTNNNDDNDDDDKVTYFQQDDGLRHVALIMDDGMGVREPESGSQFESVIKWMESKEVQY